MPSTSKWALTSLRLLNAFSRRRFKSSLTDFQEQSFAGSSLPRAPLRPETTVPNNSKISAKTPQPDSLHVEEDGDISTVSSQSEETFSPATNQSSNSGRLSSVFQTVSKATIIGRTGALPRVHTFSEGMKCATISVATNYFTSHEGTSHVVTQWHSVRVYESASVYPIIASLPTGSQVYVEGELRLPPSLQRQNDSRQSAAIIVSGNHGTVRILHRSYT